MAGTNCTKSISLSLTENYAPSWRTWEGVREFVQNWHDGALGTAESLVASGGSSTHRTAFVKDRDSYKAMLGSTVLGSVTYSDRTQSLTLINHSTALHRKVLLLGYSKKASHHDVIGQFGEGLKVGALALLRSGREVVLLTCQDRWRFRLAHDPVFQESVLTVFVAGRNSEVHSVDEMTPECPVEMSAGDTCVQIWPVKRKEWSDMAKKFLFLEPPSDSVQTESGTLLLDRQLQGQLFVKQVWVSDQSKDGLSVGVNFKQLRIDRDRRAVIHQSDINHQVSSMWIRALNLRPDLVPRYFELLQRSSASDVRHAGSYLNEATTASLIATEFFRRHGSDALPVINTATSQTLQRISVELEKKVVLCNETLLGILKVSGRVQTLDELLQDNHALSRKGIPLAQLTDVQLSVVGHALELVKYALPKVTLSNVSIYEGTEDRVTFLSGQKIDIPLWMTNVSTVHAKVTCYSDGSKCCCAEALLCDKIVSGYSSHHNTSSISVSKVIAALAQQLCSQDTPFCERLHHLDQAVECIGEAVLHQREQEQLARVEELLQLLRSQEQQHKEDLVDISYKVKLLENEVTLGEVKFVDMEQDLIAGFRKEQSRKKVEFEAVLVAKEREYKALYSEHLTNVSSLEHCTKQLTELRIHLKEENEKHTRHIEGLKTQSNWYLKRLADRINKLSELRLATNTDSPSLEVQELLHRIAAEFDEDQKKDLCLVCASNTKNCVILPCRHHNTCMSCAQVLPKCPVCRGLIQSRLHIFT